MARSTKSVRSDDDDREEPREREESSAQREKKNQTFLQLCEPLFLYLCEFNRVTRKGGRDRFAFDQVQRDVRALFEELRKKCARDPLLKSHYDEMRYPLAFFADEMVARSEAVFADQWSARGRLAHVPEGDLAPRFNTKSASTATVEMDGSEAFFDKYLAAALKDRSDETEDRLAVYYACLGLGFAGVKNSDTLQRHLDELLDRLDAQTVQPDLAKRATPRAYKPEPSDQDFTQTPGRHLLLIGILFFSLLSGVLLWCVLGFRDASDALRVPLGRITSFDAAK